jgi:hypothetical protein
MPTTTWPPDWKLCTADSPAEGLIIPLEYEDQDDPARCANCHGKKLLGFRIQEDAITRRFFQTARGEVTLRGRLVIGECPVCGKQIEKPKPDIEEPWQNRI